MGVKASKNENYWFMKALLYMSIFSETFEQLQLKEPPLWDCCCGVVAKYVCEGNGRGNIRKYLFHKECFLSRNSSRKAGEASLRDLENKQQ